MLQVEYKFNKNFLKYNFKYNFYTSLQFLNYLFFKLFGQFAVLIKCCY